MKYILHITLIISISNSSAIDDKFNYQDYLDFALNKGKYTPKKENITITPKDKNNINNIILNAPMLDFSAANQNGKWKSEFTNIGGSYGITAAHMFDSINSGTDALQERAILNFGGIASMIIDSSNRDINGKFENWSDKGVSGKRQDFAVIKTSKINLNMEANISDELIFFQKGITSEDFDHSKYMDIYQESCNTGLCDKNIGKGVLLDKDRYKYYIREGSGTQKIGHNDASQVPISIESHDIYHTGGFLDLNDVELDSNYARIPMKAYVLENQNDWFSSQIRKPFSSSSAPGDSGSAIYVYDNVDKKWYIIGVVSVSNCDTNGITGYSCSVSSYGALNTIKINEFKDKHTYMLNGGTYTINENGKISNGDNINTITGRSKGEITWQSVFNKTNFEERNKLMQNSKDILFADSGVLTINDNIDLGAGALIFNKNSNWEIKTNNNWFINGGIVANEGSKITYHATTKKDDFLHKTGSGELIITSQSPESGLRIGDGDVILQNNGIAFKEIYFTSGRGTLKISNTSNINTDYIYFGKGGGSLDINGQNISFKRIFASDNGANIINTSTNNAILKITQECGGANLQNGICKEGNINNGYQDYLYHGNIIDKNNGGIQIVVENQMKHNKSLIFDGNIDNNNGSLEISNGADVTLQGHPLIHAYVNQNIADKLKQYGHLVFTQPTTFTQDDWEHRVFDIGNIIINDSKIHLGKEATLNATITANNSTINLGDVKVWIDKKDGENVNTRIESGNYNKNLSYGASAYGVGKDMQFNQELQNNTITDSMQNINFNGKVKLDNSNLNLANMNFNGIIDSKNNNNIALNSVKFNGNINGNGQQNNLNILSSNMVGDIKNINSLFINDTKFNGNIEADSINATNSIFYINIDFDNLGNTPNIRSKKSTSGANNTLQIILENNPYGELSNKILLASLSDQSYSINEKYFKIPDIQDGFSIYTPNIEFSRNENNDAQWNLIKIEENNINPYYQAKDNIQSINKANGLLNQLVLSYIVEWNNMQKRMGELRDNPNDNGAWIRALGGGSSDENYKGNFFETQVGIDYKIGFDYGFAYIGGIFNYTNNYLSGDDISSKSNGFGVGIYSSILFDSGFYIDSILRNINYINNISIGFIPGQQNIAKKNIYSNNTIFNIECGYRYFFFNKFYIEPQIELITGYIGGINIGNNDILLAMKDSIPVNSKISLFTGKQFNISDNIADLIGYRVGIGYAIDLNHYGNRIIKDINKEREYKGIKDNRIFINLSTNYILYDKQRINIEFEKSFLGKLNIDWSINASYRINF